MGFTGKVWNRPHGEQEQTGSRGYAVTDQQAWGSASLSILTGG